MSLRKLNVVLAEGLFTIYTTSYDNKSIQANHCTHKPEATKSTRVMVIFLIGEHLNLISNGRL